MELNTLKYNIIYLLKLILKQCACKNNSHLIASQIPLTQRVISLGE